MEKIIKKIGYSCDSGQSFLVDSGRLFRANPDTWVGAKRRWLFWIFTEIHHPSSSHTGGISEKIYLDTEFL